MNDLCEWKIVIDLPKEKAYLMINNLIEDFKRNGFKLELVKRPDSMMNMDREWISIKSINGRYIN